jgi:hypothetical protein
MARTESVQYVDVNLEWKSMNRHSEQYPTREGALAEPPRALGVCTLTNLFLLALAVRCLGLLWGAKIGDENTGYPVRVLSGQLRLPGDFYPPLYHYLHAIGIAAMFVAGRLIGVWHSVEAFKAQYFTDVTPFLFAIRMVTAITGALAAPLSAGIAARLRAGRFGSLAAGVLMALFPVNVWLCHFAKNDIGLVTSVLLAAWVALSIIDQPDRRLFHVLFGAASALMVSFKQSAVFFLVPLWMGLALILLVVNRRLWPASLVDIGTWAAVGAVAWVPLNLGILLAPRDYLKFQVLVSQLWIGREGDWARVVAALAGRLTGATPLGLLLGLLSPLLVRTEKVALLWASSVVGLSLLLIVGGPIDVARHLMPYTTLLFLLGVVSAVFLANQHRRITCATGFLSLIALLAWSGSGTAEVVRQALALPMKNRILSVLPRIAQPGGVTRILGDVGRYGIRVHPDVAQVQQLRSVRLAQKYRIELPPRTSERDKYTMDGSDLYYIRDIPFAAGGMDFVTDLEIEQGIRIVTPYYWPIQQEEWHLHYWLDQGYTVFLMESEEFYLDCDIPAYKRLYQEVRRRGKLIERLPTTRELFEERSVTIYVVEPEQSFPSIRE